MGSSKQVEQAGEVAGVVGGGGVEPAYYVYSANPGNCKEALHSKRHWLYVALVYMACWAA